MTQKHLFQLLLPAAGIQLAVLHGAHSRFIRLFSPRTDHTARCEITLVLPGIRLTVAIPPDEPAPSLQLHYKAFVTVESGEVGLTPCLCPLAQTARAVFPQAAFL